jgi:hypothetical protein
MVARQHETKQDQKLETGPMQALTVLPSASPFHYEPLNADCMRLVRIEAAKTDDDPIVCFLSKVEFREKPKFHALSYMWGVGPDNCEITLNRGTFRVRQNLADALRYLRTLENDTSYWIDAICIDQDDVSDKNTQVRMMHHIYFRAETVVVWLGKRYAEYEKSLPDLRGLVDHCKPSTGQPKLESSAESSQDASSAAQQSTNDDSQQRKLAEELYNDGYWNRLWIIQEIGQANSIKVCFGNSAVEWGLFIHFITMHNQGNRGPVRLNRQRQGKYSGSGSLVQLLEDHKEALCQDNKDKVYGLIGLASDASGFIIDYEKSVFEIWTDVMEFMNDRKLFAGKDIIYVGGLVKSLLMPSDCQPLQQILREYAPGKGDVTILTDPNDPKSFKLEAAMLGVVICVGPRPDEIVGNPKEVDKWREQVQQNFKSDLGRAHQESDSLIRTILDVDDSTLSKKCFDCRSIIKWSISFPKKGNDNEAVMRARDVIREFQSLSSDKPGSESTSSDQSSFDNSRLFQMSDRSKEQTIWKMGLASSDIRSGDIILWLRWPRRAVIVRSQVDASSGRTLQAVGTAVVTEDLREPRLNCSQRDGWRENKLRQTIYLGATTIFTLLA